MYWHVKLFLLLMVTAFLGGITYMAWDYLPLPNNGLAEQEGEQTDVPVVALNGSPQQTKASSPTSKLTVKSQTNIKIKYANKLELARSFMMNNPVKGRQLVESVLRDPELKVYTEDWYEVTALLSEINQQIIFGDVPSKDKMQYVVQRGDSLWEISKKTGASMSVIAQSNNLSLDNPRIYPGQVLRIYSGDWVIRISKNQYTMQVFDGERLVKVYRIGTGRQDRTPVGKFVVTGKEKNPVWYPGGTPVAADDPRNPLGTRWMALKGTTPDTVHYRGYGIHGTKDPESIGKMESNGCIRMVNQQVENLYDYILPGVPVIIEE
ncbi:MAG: L,D-transpeptidase family protein [Lentisphaeria bacterium]|nr:L,D-transpeptidase family protein [Lentisphaeria bacterium]